MPQQKTKVLHVITNGVVGGAQIFLAEIIERLDRERFEIHVACGPEGPFVERFQRSADVFHPIPSLGRSMRPWADWQSYRRLLALMKNGRYDVVQGHTSKGIALATLAAKRLGIPVQATFHGFNSAHTEMSWWVDKFFLRLKTHLVRACEHVSVANTQLVRLLQRLGAQPKHGIAVIFCGVDHQKFDRRRVLPLRPRPDSDALVFGTAGRLTPLKGQDLFIQAAARVHSAHPAARFVVVGEGPEEANLRALARELGLDNCLEFWSFHAEFPRVLACFDSFVIPARVDGFPLVFAEAMAMGLPVILTDGVGSAEVMENGRDGIVVPRENVEALAQAMIDLLDGNRRQAMAQSAHELASEIFSWEKVARRYEEIYLQLRAAGH